MNFTKKNYYFVFITIIFSIFMISCTKEEEKAGLTPVDLRIDALVYYQIEIDKLLLTEEDPNSGGYTQESYNDLKEAKAVLDAAIDKAEDGTFRTQEEVDLAADAAELAIEAFKASKVFTVQSCELFVPSASDASNYLQFDTANVYNQRTFTVEFWFKGIEKTNSQRQGAIFSCLIHKGDNNFDGWNVNLWASDEDANGPYKLRTTRAFQDLNADGDHLIEPGVENYDVLNWHHIASVYDETVSTEQMKLYVDGVLVASATDPSWSEGLERYRPSDINVCGFKTIADANNHMAISGSIKNVRFWSKALTETEVNTFKDSDVTGEEVDLISAWDFTSTVEDTENIIDKTTNHSARAFGGEVEWNIIN